MHLYNPRRLNRWIYKCKTKILLSHRIAITEIRFFFPSAIEIVSTERFLVTNRFKLSFLVLGGRQD